jgi:hypothetical protein
MWRAPCVSINILPRKEEGYYAYFLKIAKDLAPTYYRSKISPILKKRV